MAILQCSSCDLKKTEAAVETARLIKESAAERVKYEHLHFRTRRYTYGVLDKAITHYRISLIPIFFNIYFHHCMDFHKIISLTIFFCCMC